MSNLQAERQQNTATYNQQRSVANAQNRLSAKNFQEYLASTGRANSGLSAQARMQYGNNLSTSINALNAGEAAALADIGRRTTDAQNAYNTGLASANAQIEADYINNLLSQREKELNRQLQEKQFNESVRQFNENMKFQREQLQSRFSGGSGGGSKIGTTTLGTEVQGSSPSGNKKPLLGYNDVKNGEIYFDTSGNKTVLRVKGTKETKNTIKNNTKTAKKATSKGTTKKTTSNPNNPFKSIQGTFNR